MIEMKNLGKAYGSKETATVALDHVNLTIDQGEFVAIMGKSGAGKSTLLHILGGLDTFDSGEYRLMGKNVGAMKDNSLSQLRNETIGFVMQDFALISEKTVLFNTMLPLFFDKTPWSKMKTQCMAALERVGIQELAKKRVNQLSGGQKQRVAIARAAPLPELMDRKKRDIMERKGDKEDENKRQKQQKESSAAAL